MPAKHREPQAFAICFELFVFAVASLPDLKWNLNQRTHDSEFQISQSRFNLDAFSAMVMVNVFNFERKNECELIFTGHQIKQALADIDVASGKRESVDQRMMRHEMKRIRQAPMRVGSDDPADSAEVFLQSLLFGAELRFLNGISLIKRIAYSDFFGVRQTGQAHGRAREVTLSIGRHFQYCVRRNRG